MPYTEHWIALICPLTGQQVPQLCSLYSIPPTLFNFSYMYVNARYYPITGAESYLPNWLHNDDSQQQM